MNTPFEFGGHTNTAEENHLTPAEKQRVLKKITWKRESTHPDGVYFANRLMLFLDSNMKCSLAQLDPCTVIDKIMIFFNNMKLSTEIDWDAKASNRMAYVRKTPCFDKFEKTLSTFLLRVNLKSPCNILKSY